MRKLIALLAVLLLVPVVVFADGGIFPDYERHIYEPDQKALITWDGTTETMLLATRFSSDSLGNMAWVVPLPSSAAPEVSAGNVSALTELAYYFAPAYEHRGGGGVGLGASGAANGVEVVEIKKVDIYDVTVLKATDAKALTDWLNANGYYVAPEYVPVIGRYVGEDRYFVANRIDLKNKYAATLAEVKKSNSSFENLTIDDQIGVLSDLIYGEKLSDVPAAEDLKYALYDLRSGMATPLKFKFTPPKPFYPLVISSLSGGSTVNGGDFALMNMMRIDVYVAAPTAVNDSSGVLEFDRALTVTDSFRSYIRNYADLGDAPVITRLTYFGGPGGLTADAEFVPCSGCLVENPDGNTYNNGTDELTTDAVIIALMGLLLKFAAWTWLVFPL